MRAGDNEQQRAADLTVTSHTPRFTFRASLWLALLHLALGLAQAGLFGALVAEGRSLDLAALPEPLFRVDGLNLALGVAWCLGMALVAAGSRDIGRGTVPVGVCLLTLGMLSAFYARLPIVFYLGWEVAGLGLWLAVRSRKVSQEANKHLRGPLQRASVGWILHIAGWPLLVAILLGLVAPFAPPAGGVAPAWSWPVALGLGIVVLIRSGCLPFSGWAYLAGATHIPLSALYMVSAPMLLSKMLVAAPIDAFGSWALALLGVAALLGSVVTHLLQSRWNDTTASVTALAGLILTGSGLASASPLAAAGAVTLLLTGMVAVVAFIHGDNRAVGLSKGSALAGVLPGLWLLLLGSLGSGYVVVAAVALPALATTVLLTGRVYKVAQKDSKDTALPSDRYDLANWLAAGLLVIIAVYPQALVELGVRPAVGAMAGGVGTLGLLRSDWGTGLRAALSQDGMQFSLPLTGIAVAVFLAWVALYWLKGLVSRFVSETEEAGAEAE